jgi:hypothetical protein
MTSSGWFGGAQATGTGSFCPIQEALEDQEIILKRGAVEKRNLQVLVLTNQ